MSILFNFYLAPECGICQETWPKCRAIVTDKKLLFNLNKVGKNFRCASCQGKERKELSVDEKGVPNAEVKLPLFKSGYVKVADVVVPSFPCVAFTIDGQILMYSGKNIFPLLEYIVLEKNQAVTAKEVISYYEKLPIQ